ncbi:MAG: hypothetical protein ACOX1O_00865 [Eggerthellaceae bacterium]|jgi:hypothetical protein
MDSKRSQGNADSAAQATGVRVASWIARIALIVVFVVNVQCALGFVFNPEGFVGAYELSGDVGAAAIQGLGIAFLMWNATYPLPIVNPSKHRALFGVVLAQQVIGIAGELFVLSQLPAGHAVLEQSIHRFCDFDLFGLAIMGASFVLLLVLEKRTGKRTESL